MSGHSSGLQHVSPLSPSPAFAAPRQTAQDARRPSQTSCLSFAERDLHVLDDVEFSSPSASTRPSATPIVSRRRLDGLGEIDVVGQHLPVRPDHAGELHLADAKRIAAPLPAPRQPSLKPVSCQSPSSRDSPA